MAERIYLEWKPAVVPFSYWGHFFLVKREEPVGDQFNELAWRQTGEVIRGGPANLSIVDDLVTYVGLLNNPNPDEQSGDQYETQSHVESRGSVDITGALPGGFASWGTMQGIARSLNQSGYDYEFPTNTGDINSHTANSNATILTVLNAIGVDVRDFIVTATTSTDYFGFPGADDTVGGTPTLLGQGANRYITAHENLTAEVSLLGRDDVDDIMTGTQFADKYYGEQEASVDNSKDTVSYARSEAGVTINYAYSDQGGNRSGSQGTGTGGHAQGDLLYGIENIVGSDHDDTFNFQGKHDNILIGGTGADKLYGGFGSDTADYSGSSAGVNVSLARSYWWWGSSQTASGGDAEGDQLFSIENLIGSKHDDQLKGNWKSNRLEGGNGNDLLTVGWGRDQFVFKSGDDVDTITDFDTGYSFWGLHFSGDKVILDVDGFNDFADIQDAMTSSGTYRSPETTIDFGNGDILIFKGVHTWQLNANDFDFV